LWICASPHDSGEENGVIRDTKRDDSHHPSQQGRTHDMKGSKSPDSVRHRSGTHSEKRISIFWRVADGSNKILPARMTVPGELGEITVEAREMQALPKRNIGNYFER